MGTAPVLDPSESRSIGLAVATLRFQRLERVRRDTVLGAGGGSCPLVMAVACAGVVGVAAARRSHSQTGF